MPGLAVDFWGRTKPPIGLPVDLTADLARSINGYWLLNESVGIPRDLLKGTRVSKTGTPTWKGSSLGSAYDLSAASTSAQVASTSRLAGNANFTILFWGATRGASNAPGRPLYCERGATGNAILKLESCNTNIAALTDKLFVTYRDDAGTLTQSSTAATTSKTSINDGIIRQLGMVKRGSVFELWVNGVLEGSITRSSGTDTLTATSLVTKLGGDASDATALWAGTVNQCITWTRALQSAEIQHLTQQPFALFQPPIWRRYYTVPTLPLATLLDTFDDNSTDATKWTTADTISETNQRIESAFSAGNTFTYPIYLSAKRFDLTGSYALARLINAGAQNNNTYAYFQLQFGLNGANNRLQVTIQPQSGGSDLTASYTLGGSTTTLATVTYNPATHVWFRLRESAGTLSWDTSADASTWTTLASVANPFTTPDITIRSTEAVLGGGVDGSAAVAGTTIVWDQFNVPDQPLYLTAVSPAERFGLPAAGLNLAPLGLSSGERPGAAAVSPLIQPLGIGSAERFGLVVVATVAGLTIQTTGISSAELAGALALALNLAPLGIASAEQFGSAALSLAIQLLGLSTTERFGASAAALALALLGLESAERPGASALGLNLSPAGLSSAERFGTAATGLAIALAGLLPDERFGASALTPGAVTVTALGIGSEERAGAVTITTVVGLSAAGLGTAERFGVVSSGLTVSLSGLVSIETFGLLSATPGAVTLSPAGIGSTEWFGAPAVSSLAALTLALTGILSPERSGAGAVTPGPVSIGPLGIPPSELFGPVAAALNLTPTGIGSAERAGVQAINLVLTVAAIGPSERPGVVAVGLQVNPTGIGTAERPGGVVIAIADWIVSLAGIGPGERFGITAALAGPVALALAGIASGEAFGPIVLTAPGLIAVLTVPLGGLVAASRRLGKLAASRSGGLIGASATGGQTPSDELTGTAGASRTGGHYP